MSHEFESGFAVRQPSWHGLENLLLDHPETWDEAREAAGLTWDPVSKPVYIEHVEQVIPDSDYPQYASWQIDRAVDAWEAPEDAVVITRPTYFDPFARYMLRCDEHQAIVRNDNGATLGMPSSGFSVVTNADLEPIVQGVLGASDMVKLETMGSVRGGRSVYVLAYLDEPIHIGGDNSPTMPYLCVLNSHDGSGACKVVLTFVRVVCWNTFQLADSSSFQVSLRHTGDVQGRIEAATEMIAQARAGSAAYTEEMAWLSTRPVSDEMVLEFLDDFIPVPEGASERTRDNRLARRGEFLGIYRDSETTDGIRGNAYGLTQAAGEYLDHYRPHRNDDTYLSRTMFGTPTVKARTFESIRELVSS